MTVKINFWQISILLHSLCPRMMILQGMPQLLNTCICILLFALCSFRSRMWNATFAVCSVHCEMCSVKSENVHFIGQCVIHNIHTCPSHRSLWCVICNLHIYSICRVYNIVCCEFGTVPLTSDSIVTFTPCTICIQVTHTGTKCLDILHGTQGVPCIGTFTPQPTETVGTSPQEAEKLTERWQSKPFNSFSLLRERIQYTTTIITDWACPCEPNLFLKTAQPWNFCLTIIQFFRTL